LCDKYLIDCKFGQLAIIVFMSIDLFQFTLQDLHKHFLSFSDVHDNTSQDIYTFDNGIGFNYTLFVEFLFVKVICVD
jgi:hypothetical protein